MRLSYNALEKREDVIGLKRTFCSIGGGINGKPAGLESDVIDIAEATEVRAVSC